MYPKNILVTGACRGVGLELVKQLLRLHEPPGHIFAASMAPDKAKELNAIAHESPAVKILKLDYFDLGTVKPLADQIAQDVGDRGLNLLINNAGIYRKDNLPDITPENMRDSYEVNVVGPLMLTQALVPLLKIAAQTFKPSPRMCVSHAAVVNISSHRGSIGETRREGGKYPFRCSKAALNMMTKALSCDLLDDGILVMSIEPGKVRTDTGGPDANVSLELSVEGMIDVMSKADNKSTGTFRGYGQKIHAW